MRVLYSLVFYIAILFSSCTLLPAFASPVPTGKEVIDIIDKLIVSALGHHASFVINEIMIIDASSDPGDEGDVMVDVTILEGRYILVIHDGHIVAAQKLLNKAPETSCDSPLLPSHP